MTPDPTHSGSVLERAIEVVLGLLPDSPTLSAFGIAREDCALVHIDYFHDIEVAKHELAAVLAEARETDVPSIWREFCKPEKPCDNSCCATPEVAKAAREKHIASYTNVKEWVVAPDA